MMGISQSSSYKAIQTEEKNGKERRKSLNRQAARRYRLKKKWQRKTEIYESTSCKVLYPEEENGKE
jgi:hypothetical protein